MKRGEEILAKPLILKKPVIAIVGSAGKTTTKEMLAAILQTRWKIFKTFGNANAPRHTAMYARKIQKHHKAAVLEYGMSKPGEIRRSTLIIRPNIGVVTNIGTAHIGHFNGSIKGIANTKSDLIRYMKQDGLLFINADDKNSKLLDTKKFKGEIVKVSQHVDSNYKAVKVHYEGRGMAFQVKIDNIYHKFYIPVYGKHNVYNALFAIAVARYLGFKIEDIKLGLKRYKKPYRRLSVYRLNNDLVIIDDSFSANLNASKAAIDVLSTIGKGKKVAILGSMLEMGKYKQISHKEVGRYLARKKIDYLLTYGIDATIIAKGAIEAGFPKTKIRSFYSQEKLINYLYRNIDKNSTILFKGSHAMRLDKVVKAYVKLIKK